MLSRERTRRAPGVRTDLAGRGRQSREGVGRWVLLGREGKELGEIDRTRWNVVRGGESPAGYVGIA